MFWSITESSFQKDKFKVKFEKFSRPFDAFHLEDIFSYCAAAKMCIPLVHGVV